jgi:MFS family permease
MTLFHDLYLSRKPVKSFVLMAAMWACFAVMMPDLKAQIGASDAQFGMAFMIGNLGAFVTAWAAPRVDNMLGKFALSVAGIGMALSLLIMGLSGALWAFVMGMFLAALSSGICDILMNARVVEIETVEKRPLMNLNHAVFSFAYAGFALLGGVLRESGGSPTLAGFLVVILAVCFIPGSIITSTAPDADNTMDGQAAQHAAKRAARVVVWLIGVVVLTSFITEHTVETWSALHLERTLGGTAAQGALGPAIIGLTMGVGRLFGQVLANRVKDMALLVGACLVSALGMAMTGLAPDLTAAYIGLTVLGLGIALVFPLAISLVGRVVPAHDRVRAIGQATVIGYGAFFVGPTLVGVSAEMFGLRIAFVLVAGVMVSVAVLIVPAIAKRAVAQI